MYKKESIQLEAIIEESCPACLDGGWKYFCGVQEGFDGYYLLLYNCESCGSTRSYQVGEKECKDQNT